MGPDERFDPSGKRYLVEPEQTIELPHSRELGAGAYKYDALDPDPPDVVWSPVVPSLIVRPRGQGGWYDVVNPATGKPINDRALRYSDALELAGSDPDGAQPETEPADGETNPVPVETVDGFDETGGPVSETDALLLSQLGAREEAGS
jgi:hypothetical protein